MKSFSYQKPETTSISIASEPEMLYMAAVKVQVFSISKFNKLGKKLDFSQAEWASILHISDRTLQRYIKDNKPFEGLYAEHLLQLENMANLGFEVFETPDKFKAWLMRPKPVLGIQLDFNTLNSFWGVKLVSNELGRIAYGVYI